MIEKTRSEVVSSLLNPQIEALIQEYKDKADEELEDEWETVHNERIKIVSTEDEADTKA